MKSLWFIASAVNNKKNASELQATYIENGEVRAHKYPYKQATIRFGISSNWIKN